MTSRAILADAGSNSRRSINQTLALYAGHVHCEIFPDSFGIVVIDLNDFEMPTY
ncbi:MAG: hypothetical protein AAF665_14615 [Pseudomonadota bacterium]